MSPNEVVANAPDLETAFNQIEAGRIKTLLERNHNIRVKYREIVAFTPAEVAESLKQGLTPGILATYAGRR